MDNQQSPVTQAKGCTCMEVFGENPNCTLHGPETAWALENTLPSEWQAQVIELRQMLAELARLTTTGPDVGREDRAQKYLADEASARERLATFPPAVGERLIKWQEGQSEWFSHTLLEIVAEFIAFDDAALEPRTADGGDVEPFEREGRYIVIKRSHLQPSQWNGLRALLDTHHINPVEAVVVEADWPEYEPVWSMIEARVTGGAK